MRSMTAAYLLLAVVAVSSGIGYLRFLEKEKEKELKKSSKKSSTSGVCTMGKGGVRAIPLVKTKIVHFIRHAKGFHNEASHPFERNSQEYYDALHDYRWFDAHLSPEGERQCRALAPRTPTLEYEIIIVSPLTRTLETASLVFPGDVGGGRRTFLALEDVRERFGEFPCDSRRGKDDLVKDFPHVDFSLIQGGEDPYNPCTPERGCEPRESNAHIDVRIKAFIKFIAERPEQKIAVVTHSSWLARAFEAHFGWQEKDGAFRFDNAELRSVVIELPSEEVA